MATPQTSAKTRLSSDGVLPPHTLPPNILPPNILPTNVLPPNILPTIAAQALHRIQERTILPNEALMRLVSMGSLSNTVIAPAETQVDELCALCLAEEQENKHESRVQTVAAFIIPSLVLAKAAIFARESLKNLSTQQSLYTAQNHTIPALLTALLSTRPETELLKAVFPRTIDTVPLLRLFVYIMRSGMIGRHSLGTLPKRLVLDWLAARSDEEIYHASLETSGVAGHLPTLTDIIRMVHPKPETASRRALYGFLLGRFYDEADLPVIVRATELDASQPKAAVSESKPIPTLHGKVHVFVDVSRSLHSEYAPSVRFLDLAAEIISTLKQANPSVECAAFAQNVIPLRIETETSTSEIATMLTAFDGKETSCHAALRYVNEHALSPDMVILLSDNESWRTLNAPTNIAFMREWEQFRHRKPDARLLCYDLQPDTFPVQHSTPQTERADILRLGGYSPDIFQTIAQFSHGAFTPEHWQNALQSLRIDAYKFSVMQN